MSGALLVTALVMRSPSLPRWSLVAAAAVMAAGLLLPVLIVPDIRTWTQHPIGTGGYGWCYLMLLGGARSAGPRWCHSPWTAVGAAVALTAGIAVAQGLR